MRIVFLGSGAFGIPTLESLARRNEVVAVVSQPDKPAGRGKTLAPTPIAMRAAELGIPVLKPEDINRPDARDAVRALRADAWVVIAFGQKLSAGLLEGVFAVNLHGSLLPAYRGRAPVNWVLVNGETETGVTLHYMDEKPDHGDVVARRRVAIDRDDTALTLTRKLAAAGRETMREALPLLESGRAPREPQDHARSSYFGGRKPADGAIDWTWPAERVRNLVRAVTEPWPGAFTHLGGEPLLVWWAETAPALEGARPGAIVPGAGAGGVPRVACGEGAIDLVSVGWRGEKTDGARWLAAAGPAPGARFDAPAAAGKERT